MVKENKLKVICILFLIFVLALFLRLVYLNEARVSPLFYPSATGLDDSIYHQRGGEIAGGDWLGKGPLYGMPLYPYFLGLSYAIFGINIATVKFIQFILGSLSCVLIYLIGRKVFNHTVATISALLAAVYGPFIFYEEILVATSLTVFLYLFSFLVLLWALDVPSGRRFFVFGLVAGVSALSKASILLFTLALFIWLFRKYRPWQRSLLYVCYTGLGLLFAIAPIILRNYIVCKDFIPLASHGGINFYIGNNPDASGTFRTPRELGGTPKGLLTNSRVIAERIKGMELKPSQVSQFWFSRAINFIKTQPQKFLLLLEKKFLLFINFYEIPDVRDYRFACLQSPILKMLLRFNVVFILSILGIVLSRGHNYKSFLLKMFVFMYIISVVLFFVNSRYRLPVVPFLIILAGAGIYNYIGVLKRKSYRQALICLLLLIIFFILGGRQLVQSDFSGTYNNFGLYYLEKGNYPQAIAQFKKATELNSRMDIAYYNMGKAFMELGQREFALENFEKALDINPYLYAAYNDRGNVFLSMNNLDEAYEQFVKALEINPEYAQAHANLGLVYKKKKLYDLAIKEYKESLRLDGSLAAEIYNNIGLVYFRRNQFDDAILYFEKAVALRPNLACSYYNLGLIFAKKGMLGQAKKYWEKVIELKPEFSDAQKKIDGLEEMGY